jgi:hypothetical protein
LAFGFPRPTSRNSLHEYEQTFAGGGAHFVKGTNQPQRSSGVDESKSLADIASRPHRPFRTLEEKTDRNPKYFGDAGESAGTNSVDALLVFLNLLEGDTEFFRKVSLGYTTHQALGSD